MKLSEIISHLQKLRDEQGDLEVDGFQLTAPESKTKPAKAPFSPPPPPVFPAAPEPAPEMATLHEQRMAICRECPKFTKIKIPFTDTFIHQCLECGCVMEAKTRFKSMKCPLGKW